MHAHFHAGTRATHTSGPCQERGSPEFLDCPFLWGDSEPQTLSAGLAESNQEYQEMSSLGGGVRGRGQWLPRHQNWCLRGL